MSKFVMHRVKMTDLTEPRTGLARVFVDHWWAVSQDDELYFFGTHRHPYGSPQCNSDETLARDISEGMARSASDNMRYENYKGIRQIPVVFVPESESRAY